MFFPRAIKSRIIEFLGDFRIVYLTGPRQSGKSTLAREVAEELGMGYASSSEDLAGRIVTP